MLKNVSAWRMRARAVGGKPYAPASTLWGVECQVQAFGWRKDLGHNVV